MNSISGTIRIGEAQATCAATAKRQRGPTWQYISVMAGLWIGGAVIGFAVGLYLNANVNWTACGGALVGLFLYRPLANRWVVWRYRHRLTGTGTPLDMPARWEISPEAATYEVADVVKRAKWSCVSEVFYAKGYWIFMVQAEPWFVADHFFANDTDKRAFLRETLSYMSEAARARSGDAVKFAGG